MLTNKYQFCLFCIIRTLYSTAESDKKGTEKISTRKTGVANEYLSPKMIGIIPAKTENIKLAGSDHAHTTTKDL